MGVLVRKRHDGWYVVVNHRGTRQSTKVGPDKESAEKIAKKVRVALASGTLQLERPAGPTFKEYSEAWLRRHPTVANIKESTAEGYEKSVRLYLLPAFGNRPLSAITRADVKELIARLRASGSRAREGQGLGQGYVKLIMAGLRVLLDSAVDDGLIQSNPASRVGKWNQRHTEREAEGCDPFTAKELEAIATTAQEHVPLLWPLVGFWAQTGMRAGEVFGLQLKDLDLEAGTAIVRRTLSQGRLGSPKTGKSRVVTIRHPLLEDPEAVLEALRGLCSIREAEAAVQGQELDPEAFVFLWPNGRPVPHRAFLKAWLRCLKLAGVRYRYPEQLRHTFASTLLSRNWPLLYVQRQGGWANAAVLLKVYARWIPQEAPAQAQPAATPAQLSP